jgi:hypothetical protein
VASGRKRGSTRRHRWLHATPHHKPDQTTPASESAAPAPPSDPDAEGAAAARAGAGAESEEPAVPDAPTSLDQVLLRAAEARDKQDESVQEDIQGPERDDKQSDIKDNEADG